MRPLRTLVIYLVIVFLGGALLAPWLYRLVQTVAPSFPLLDHSPFHRLMDRSLLLMALVGLWPLLRGFGVTSGRDIGLLPPRGQWKKFGGGLLLGSLTLAVAAGIALGSGNRTLAQNLTAHQIVGTIFNAVTAAVVVAFLEEILFRGGIFGGLRRNFYWPLALAVSSLIYAFVHFLQPADPAGPVAWNTGLILLPQMLAGFLNFSALVPAFLTLTLAGILLGLGYQLTGNLYFSFGLHAGWIFWLKTYGAFTIDAPQAVTRFYGTGRLIDGWLTFLVLAVTLAVFNVLPLKPARAPYTISR